MKVRPMNFRSLLTLTALGLVLASAVNAAANTWTTIYADTTNGLFVSAISTTASLTTPPLPLRFPGSQVALTINSTSGSAQTFQPWATVGAPIGSSTSVVNTQGALTASVALTSATGGSVTLITTNNVYHDVGLNISATAGSAITARVIELRQNQNTANQ